MNKSIRRSGRLTPLILLALCLVLGYRLVGGEHELATPDTALPVGDGPRQAVSATAAAPYAMPPLSAFSETIRRPLFSTTRRYQNPDPALLAGAPVQAGSGEIVLVGIIIAGEDRIALVRRRNDSTLLRVVTGQEITGWSVEEILPTSAILRRGNVRETLVLEDKISVKARPGRSLKGPGKPNSVSPIVREKAGS